MISAAFANAENTAAVVMTQESAAALGVVDLAQAAREAALL